MKSRNYLIGLLCVFGYVALAALREVLVAVILKGTSIFLVIPIIFSVSTLMFSSLQCRRFPTLFRKVVHSFRDVLSLNIATLIGWCAFIFALQFVEPAVVSSIVTSLGPISTIGFGLLLFRDFSPTKTDIVCAIGILCTVTWFVYLTASGRTGAPVAPSQLALLGIAGAIISGISSAITNIVAKRLVIKDFSAADNMAIRFYFLDRSR